MTPDQIDQLHEVLMKELNRDALVFVSLYLVVITSAIAISQFFK